MNLDFSLSSIETRATDFVAGLAPWAAPIPTAYLVYRASVKALAWPGAIALCAALIVESLGLAATSTALTLWQYNQSRKKTDPGAPFWLAAGLVGAYVFVAVLLTVALDILPELARYAPAVFPLLSLTGVSVLALRSDHTRRLEAIKNERLERRAERQAAKQATALEASKIAIPDPSVDRMQAGKAAAREARLDALLTVLLDNPDIAIAAAGRQIGVSRQTASDYVDLLEGAGRLHKNGNGWEGGAK